MDAERVAKVVLTVVDGPEKGRTFEYTEQDNFLLGRDANGSQAHCRLGPDDKYVSRNHFLLEVNPPDCFLRDAGSLNGTFVVRRGEAGQVFFLEGRDAREWEAPARKLAELFACQAVQKGPSRLGMEHGDLIRVGRTVIEIAVTEEMMTDAADNAQGGTNLCVECGAPLSAGPSADRAPPTQALEGLCEQCRLARGPQDFAHNTSNRIMCAACGEDVTTPADSDGRAAELREVALYWCRSCAEARREAVPIAVMGGCRLLRELGSGGFGVVYLGWQETTGRVVALKLTRDKVKRNERMLARFKHEISIMRELRHPHLVRLYDEGLGTDDSYYFVSEYLPRGSLADYLRARPGGTVPYREACDIIAQALDGLAYFHNIEGKYIHRDLKPAKILLSDNGPGKLLAKIGDFGLARSYILRGGTITREGEWAGTQFFCAPEQIYDFRRVTPAADVYSLGITLYYLITGEFPYHFPSRQEMLELIARKKKVRDPVDIILGSDQPTPVEKKAPQLPKGLAAAINRAIEKKASRRFDSAIAFSKAIEEYCR